MGGHTYIASCAAWLTAAALAACQGGQSGTDGSTSTECPVIGERSVRFDEVTSLGTAAELREKVERALAQSGEAPLRWTPEVGGTTTLTIEVREWGSTATLRESEAQLCDHLFVPVTLRLATADGLLDEVLTGNFDAVGLSWTGSLGFEALQDSAVARMVQAALGRTDFVLQDFGATVQLRDLGLSGELTAISDTDDDSLAAALLALARFDSFWPRNVALGEVHRVPSAFAAACAVTRPSELGFGAFSSNDDLLRALAGPWIRCASTSTNTAPHDGIVFAADGSWKHVVERSGTLFEQLGFRHEGTYEVIDTSEINERNVRQLNIDRVPQEFLFSTDRRTLRLVQPDFAPDLGMYDTTYVRTELPVGPPQITRAVHERAGREGCAEGEAFVHGFASIDELRAILSGSWAICSGGFRDGAVAIAFESDGTYRHIGEDGATIASGRYELLDTSTFNGEGATQVNMTDDDAPPDRLTRVYAMSWPLLADAPLKLWARGETSAVLSALP